MARLAGAAPQLGRRGVVIAIDGPAASGKGTLAKRVAAHFGVPCLDTGLLYRAVARDVLQSGRPLDDAMAAVAAAKALDPASLNDPDLRSDRIGEAASVVAKDPDVRAALLDYQRAFAAQPTGAVLDGRDIGTVVCPAADVKIYVTASPEERAKRRHKELEGRGESANYETVLADIHLRDERDMGRSIAPLWPANDAVTLDTTKLDADQAFAAALKIVDFRLSSDETA
ncbi:MAG: (d)CMP kinase [Hyphomicrobium sp.]